MRLTSRTASRSLALPDERSLLRQLGALQWGVLGAALLLTMVGLLTIHSASSELATDYLPRQGAWIVLGLVAMAVAFAFDHRLLMTLAPALWLATLVALSLVLVLGKEAGGARSWVGLGTLGGQPSEFAKIATVLLLARYLSRINRPWLGFHQILIAGCITLAPMVLIVLQRDLGSAAMFVPILGGMLLVAGVRWQVMVAAVLLAIVVGLVAWNFFLLDYQKDRILTFASPDLDPRGAGYQLRQSKIAVGSGQVLGRGYLQGTQSHLRFLPARHTDFVVAVLAEEWGFLGVLVVLGLYALYIAGGTQVAARARDRAGVLLVVGLLSGTAFHVLYNTGMVIGLVPITGIPIPFLSYGGSFVLANFVATGLILGVDFRRYVNR